jgi:hypothetical protein
MTLQAKFIKAEAIIKETKFMLKLQDKWWASGREDDLDRLKSQGKKVREMIDDYYPKSQL